MKKWQLTGPDPATSRPIADPLAAEPRFPPASIDPLIHSPLKTGSAAKGLAIGLEVAGSFPVSCHFSFPSLSYHV